tara:strand:+ start:3828 stop:6167 length:2340 start_codon:yes stop_codon:yes gene_type:complete
MAHTKKTIAGNVNNGTANTFSYSGSFDVFKASEVEVELDNIALTFTTSTINESASPREYTVDFNNKTVHIGGANLTSSDSVVIQPVTDMGDPTPRATYTAGSSITSQDLNNNQLQLLRKALEYNEQKLASRGGTMTGNLHMGQNVDLTFEGDTENNFETSITVADPTADRTITFPDTTGTVITTGDTGTVATGMIAADAVTGAKIGDDQINSEHYVDGSIDTAHIGNSQVTEAKLANSAVTTAKLANLNVTSAKIAADAITTAKIADDQVTQAKIADDAVGTDQIEDLGVTTAKIASNAITTGTIMGSAVTTAKIANDAVTADKIADAAIVTNSEQASATPDDVTFFTTAAAEARYFNATTSETIKDGDAFPDNDTTIATTAAINDRIIDLVDDVGGFVPIANETSFPNANPDVNNGTGTLVSIKALSQNLTSSGSGVISISNGTVGNSTVTITGAANSTTYAATFGMIVETTTTLNTYTFHRLVPKATEVTTVAANVSAISTAATNVADINNFADIYQISNSAPTARADSSSLANGDLWFDSSSNKVLMIYDGSSGDGFSAATPNQSDLININIVAGQIVFSEDLGLITDAVNTGSGNNSVNTVAGSIANVNTAATNIANINTVAGNNSNITAVAGNSSNINSAVSNASNINSAVSNASNINSAVSNASNINTVAGSISNVNTVGASIADVNRYAAEYVIQSGTPSSPSAGDLWYNTGTNVLNYYSGSSFVGIAPGIQSLAEDSSPELAAALDCNDNNLTEVGTVNGNNLQIDFGTLS